MNCDELELAMTMRAQGALAADECARLDEHLLGCERCRDFQASMNAIDESLGRHQQQEVGGVNMEAIRKSIEHHLGRRRLQFAGSLAFMAVWVFLGDGWMEAVAPSGHAHLVGRTLLGLLFFGSYSLVLYKEQGRKLEAVVKGEGDLLTFWRGRLVARQKFLGQVWLLMALCVPVLVALMWGLHQPGTERQFYVGAAALTLFAVGLVVWAKYARTRITRELTSLE